VPARTPALPDGDAALERRCKTALANHRRRARRDRQVLDYDLAELLNLARNSPTCSYCGCLLTAGTFTFDHAVPTCRWADYSLGNLAVCCLLCQERKGLLTADEYRQLLALVHSWHPRAGADLLGWLRHGARRYRGGV
jgi:hypothetical protein